MAKLALASNHEIHHEAVWRVVELEVLPWIRDATVVGALRQQNASHQGFTQDDVEALDAKWRQELLADERPLIDAVLATELSQFLKRIRAESDGLLTEIFVVDRFGLNVGQSDVTSDYWQGDEAKWQKTFLQGVGAVFIDKVEEDESTQQFQAQVSLAIADPDTTEVIGSVTIGVDVDMAMDLES